MKNELNKKFQYGWYGTCEEDCTPLYFSELQDRNYIESVYEYHWQMGVHLKNLRRMTSQSMIGYLVYQRVKLLMII